MQVDFAFHPTGVKFTTNLASVLLIYYKFGECAINLLQIWRVCFLPFGYFDIEKFSKIGHQINWLEGQPYPIRAFNVPWPATFAPKNRRKGHQTVWILWIDTWKNMWQNFELK